MGSMDTMSSTRGARALSLICLENISGQPDIGLLPPR